MDDSDVTKKVGSHVTSGHFVVEGQGDGAPADVIERCSHCDFTSSSASRMTQHRWEVHPLLTRRKQHLVKMSPNLLKRRNSEPSRGQCDRTAVDDVTPSKKQLNLCDITKNKETEAAREDQADGVYSLKAFAEEFDSIEKKTKSTKLTNSEEPHSQCAQNARKSAKLSLIDGMAAAPLVSWYSQRMTECITSLMRKSPGSCTPPQHHLSTRDGSAPLSQPIVSSGSSALFTYKIPTSSKTASRDSSVLSQRSGISTGSRSELRSSEDLALRTVNSFAVSAPKATDCMNPSGALINELHALDDKTWHGYFANTRRDVAFPPSPFSLVPCSSAVLGPSAYFPIPGSNPSIHHNLSQAGLSPFLSGYLPSPMFPKMPLCMTSPASVDVTKSFDDVTARNAIPSSPILLSRKSIPPVSGRPLLTKTEKSDGWMTSPTSFPSNAVKSRSTPENKGYNWDSAKVPYFGEALLHQTQTPIQDFKTNLSPGTKVGSSMGNRKAQSDSFTPSSFSNGASAMQSDAAYSTSARERPIVIAQAMDNDRVRVLEAALRNTDCCDPNERSSVLPFRCSDGKWQMVRTKRIGAFWLVQFPNCEKTWVYLADLKRTKNSENTLDNWLKEQLASFKGNFADPKTEDNSWMRGGQRCPGPAERSDGVSNLSSASISDAHNQAIRSLLVPKTALA